MRIFVNCFLELRYFSGIRFFEGLLMDGKGIIFSILKISFFNI